MIAIVARNHIQASFYAERLGLGKKDYVYVDGPQSLLGRYIDILYLVGEYYLNENVYDSITETKIHAGASLHIIRIPDIIALEEELKKGRKNV